MAYADQHQRNSRPFVLTGVALLHAAVGYALVTGLGVSYVKEIMPVFEAKNYTLEPPPPPPEPLPSFKPEPAETRLTAPRQAIPNLPAVSPTIIEVPLPPVTPASDAGGLINIDPPKPIPPSLQPRAPRPRGNTGGWATTNDYPARDLREGNQGMTRFSLSIGADGRVQSCAIVASSGFPGLDSATCDNVSRRARFDPATDSSGNRVAGTYIGSIRWQIPD